MKVSVLSHQYDEVYGSLGAEGLFTEITAWSHLPAFQASDHFVRAYGETYGLPYVFD
jgi:dTDP-glucose 4,6-dehydratase